MDSVERIRAGTAQGGKPPDQMSPQELHSIIWQVLTFRDSGEKFKLGMILSRAHILDSREEN
jgi:hypothetical protein